MINKILTFLSLATIALAAYAQDYKYAAVYEAVGPVKEIKTDSQFALIQKKVKIDKKGMGGLPVMLYDDSGYPLGFEMNMMGKQIFQKFFWNDQNRLDSVAVRLALLRDYKLISAKNVYSDGNVITQEIDIETKDGGIKYIRLFSDYIFDDKGNWISRKVRQTAITKDCDKTEEEFNETRTLKYYN